MPNATKKINTRLLTFNSKIDQNLKLDVNLWEEQLFLNMVKFPKYVEGQTNRPELNISFPINWNNLHSFGCQVGIIGHTRTEAFLNSSPYPTIPEYTVKRSKRANERANNYADGLIMKSGTYDGKEFIELIFCKGEDNHKFVFGGVYQYTDCPELKVDTDDMSFLIFSGYISDIIGLAFVSQNGQITPKMNTQKATLYRFIAKTNQALADTIISSIAQMMGQSPPPPQSNSSYSTTSNQSASSSDDIPF